MSIETAMSGLSICQDGKPCEYHGKKVPFAYGGAEGSVGSQNPPKDVWSTNDQNAIAALVDTVEKKTPTETLSKSLMENISKALAIVSDYWADQDHQTHLNTDLYKAWSEWQNHVPYGAGSWMASPVQLSQYIATIKTLDKSGLPLDQGALRIGTASGKHTQQEIFALAKGGITKPKLAVIDACLPPLKETQTKAKSSVGQIIHGNLLETSLPNQFPIVTTHFIESFVPTKEQADAQQISHLEAMKQKIQFFNGVYNALMPNGVFIMAIGTSKAEHRVHDANEIGDLLETSGFSADHTIIIPTVDPFDYANGQFEPGNYFVVAQKTDTQKGII